MSTSMSRGWRSRVWIVTLSSLRLAWMTVPVIPFSTRCWPLILDLLGEDHLVAGCQPVGLARQLDAVLVRARPPARDVLALGVHRVALFVAAVGDHHGLLCREALAALIPVLDHCLRRLGTGVVDVQAIVCLVAREC